ncbi:unnamed protein product [Cunninghamella blakesleeana]
MIYYQESYGYIDELDEITKDTIPPVTCELLAAAAAYLAWLAFRDYIQQNNVMEEKMDYNTIIKLLIDFVETKVDDLFESKNIHTLDKEIAKYEARKAVEKLYDEITN